MNRPRYYILLNVTHTPIAVDVLTWEVWFATHDRHVAQTRINKACDVSTIFLGLDHNHSRLASRCVSPRWPGR